MPYIYKVLRNSEWQTLLESGFFTGSAADLSDGFIHLSYAGQVAETARKHFSGADGLVLAQYDAADFGPELKAEPSRGGAFFPHLYAPLPHKAIHAHWILTRGADGAPIIPPLPEA